MKRILLFGAIALSLNSNSQVPNYAPTNGLIGWWPFTGNANDESVNSNNGTVNGATLTTDRNGNGNNAYNFDGISNYIQLPLLTSLNNQSQISASIWINSDYQYNEDYKTILSHWLSTSIGSGPIGLQLSVAKQGTSNQGGLGVSLAAAVGAWSSPNLISANAWNHVVFIYDGTNVNEIERFAIYVNGSLQGYFGDSNVPASSGNSSDMTVIGASVGPVGAGVYNYFPGQLDDIGLWNRALTNCEVADLYNSQLGSLNTTSTQTESALDSYTWSVNNQTYTSGGSYNATIPNDAGCDSIITLDLTLNFTSIKETALEQFSVYPNPAKTQINVLVNANLVGSSYVIYDNTGKSILSGKIISENTTLELINLSGGIYMFSVGEDLKQTFKVIKE